MRYISSKAGVVRIDSMGRAQRKGAQQPTQCTDTNAGRVVTSGPPQTLVF